VGFDAGQVEPDSDARLVFRASPFLYSVNDVLKQHRKLARKISGVDRGLRNFGGMDQGVRDVRSSNLALSAARLAGITNPVGASTASIYADLAKSIVPESMRLGLPGLSRTLANIGYYPRPQSDALRYGKMFGNLGVSSSIAQAARAAQAQSFASINSADWSLRIVHSFRTPALQSILNSSTTFGPIVVSPDDEALPSNYHPDLQRWIIPETATKSGEAIDVEELLSQVFTFAVDKARQYRSDASISVVGKSGLRYLVRVSESVVGGLILFWLLHH
jgi:hypothetical protein